MKTPSAHQLALWSSLAGIGCWCFCIRAAPPPNSSVLQISAELCERTSRIFPQADLFKPGTQRATNLDFDLSPLILQQVASPGGSSSCHADFGSLRVLTNALALDFSAPAIYTMTDTIELNAKLHRRLTFLWFYSLEPASPTNQALPLQGLRVTLDNSGKPGLWEVLADPASVDLVFVSRSLELAAHQEFGRPLPGRHFSIERSIDEAASVFVAGLLEDAAVPMGPIIHLSSGTHAVSTVICRCMPTQAKSLRQTGSYELIDANNDQLQSLFALAKARLKMRVSFWPDKGGANNTPAGFLRLPASF